MSNAVQNHTLDDTAPARTLRADQDRDLPHWLAGASIRIAALTGWRRSLLAIAAGAASILSLAPFFASPVLFVTLPVLVWLIDGARQDTTRAISRILVEAGWVGWCFGFGFHVVGLYWLRESFAVTGGNLELLWPLAVIGLPAGLALFHALAAMLAALAPGPALHRAIALALALSATEWLRGHLFTGFPWNILGYALTWPLVLMQSAALVGIYGLTLMVVLICASPAVILASAPTAERGASPWIAAALFALLPLGLMTAWGAWRLAAPRPAFVEGVKLRLVQPNVPQRAKWQSERQGEFFDRHLELSGTNPAGQPDRLAGITHVLWPEAAMPFQPLRYPNVLAAIGAALPDGVHLLAGMLRSETEPGTGAVGSDRILAYNSVGLFDTNGRPVSIYDKNHLVPFGEYLPFQSTLESIGLKALTRQRGGFAIGPRPRPLMSVPGLPSVGILICYEGIFPAAVIQGPERPGLLFNSTNDGWFGNSTGPRQHLQQVRVRAVEEGIPLVRVANNGISAAFDPYGRELVRIDLNIGGVADTSLPVTLQPPIYARFGDWPATLCWLVTLLGLARAQLQRPRR